MWFLQFNCYYSIIFSILVLLLLGVIVHSVDGPLDGLAKCPWCALALPVDMWYIKCNNATIIIMIIIIVNIIIIIIFIKCTPHPSTLKINEGKRSEDLLHYRWERTKWAVKDTAAPRCLRGDTHLSTLTSFICYCNCLKRTRLNQVINQLRDVMWLWPQTKIYSNAFVAV